MDIKKFLLGISLGYVFALLMVYILFDYFSWSIALGFALGIGLFGLLVKMLGKRNN
ncbi:hypothetical protein ACQKII_05470 [Lysinibacillus sp. NPDC048646]|uniref:hypothetical protein n=1 Tax=Lysinibacillus sp. NPDC048646 TaxID=3390574 RepID=UPI003CFE57F3